MQVERPPMSYSGIFFDGADLEDFRKWATTGILGGATTNPVILKESQVLDVPSHIKKMIEIAGSGFPISVEIPDTRMTVEEMVDLGKRYRDRFPDNAVIKVPMDPRTPTKGLEAMNLLSEAGVRINATLGLTGGQLIAAAEALRKSRDDGDNYISLFWGRRNEARQQLVGEAFDAGETLTLVRRYLQVHGLDGVRVIVGSVRTPHDIDQAFALAADIVTIKPRLLEQWMYTKRGEETAEEFNKAYYSVRGQVKLI